MTNSKPITLNDHQETAVDKLKLFIESKNTQEFKLLGRGGVGKTSVISRLAHTDWDENPIKICFLAPTNKACQILSKNAGGIPVSTIHKFFDMMLEYTEDGKGYFPCVLKKKYKNTLLIVDECSMINDEQYELFTQFLKQDKMNKVIWVGDHKQLLSLNEEIVKEDNKNCKGKEF